jgi:hypothetical protein
MMDHGSIRRRHSNDRPHINPGAPTGCDSKAGGSRSLPRAIARRLATKIHAVADAQGRAICLSLIAGQGQIANQLPGT